MSNKRVVIVGDSCVDLYWVGVVSGLSAEAPVPVVKQTSSLALPGMAGNVQKLLQDLGGVETQLVLGPNPHLPIKNRLVTEDGTQLARWDVEDWCTPIPDGTTLIEDVGATSAVIISDYGKGAVDARLVKELRTFSEGSDVPLFVDTKSDPFVWIGLPNVTLFPNALEYAQWKAHYDWMPSVVYKHGASGMTYLEYGEAKFSVPARATQVKNVCGAGDSVLAAFTHAIVTGRSPEDAMYFAADCAGSFVSSDYKTRSIISACGCVERAWS